MLVLVAVLMIVVMSEIAAEFLPIDRDVEVAEELLNVAAGELIERCGELCRLFGPPGRLHGDFLLFAVVTFGVKDDGRGFDRRLQVFAIEIQASELGIGIDDELAVHAVIAPEFDDMPSVRTVVMFMFIVVGRRLLGIGVGGRRLLGVAANDISGCDRHAENPHVNPHIASSEKE
jgi:hypothetical protein